MTLGFSPLLVSIYAASGETATFIFQKATFLCVLKTERGGALKGLFSSLSLSWFLPVQLELNPQGQMPVQSNLPPRFTRFMTVSYFHKLRVVIISRAGIYRSFCPTLPINPCHILLFPLSTIRLHLF